MKKEILKTVILCDWCGKECYSGCILCERDCCYDCRKTQGQEFPYLSGASNTEFVCSACLLGKASDSLLGMMQKMQALRTGANAWHKAIWEDEKNLEAAIKAERTKRGIQ